MSIEFGILAQWSTINLVPQHRVDMDEADFLSLGPVLKSIQAKTGLAFDMYSSTEISGNALEVFIEELTMFLGSDDVHDKTLLENLIRSADYARSMNQPFQYRGL